MTKYPIDLEFFRARLRARNPITFVRYGDGEFHAILGGAGENCDHHQYFPRMGSELAMTLMQSRTGNYMYAIGPKAANSAMRQTVQEWLDQYAPDISWNDSEVFLKASLAGQLGELVGDLVERRVVLVGAEHLERLPFPLPKYWQHVRVPATDAWLRKKEIFQQTARAVDGAEVLLLCAGMLSKILAWELFPQWGARGSIWDMGSVFDMYCGVDSRSYARRMTPSRKAQLLEANFGARLNHSKQPV